MLAADIMTRRPTIVTPDTTLDRSATILRRGRFRHLPVVTEGRLVGIVSDRDVQRALASDLAGQTPVQRIMREGVVTATADTSLEQLARLLEENKIGCLPITSPTESQCLEGLVTESDVFRALVHTLGVGTPGTRLVIQLEHPERDLASVATTLHQLGVPLLGLHSEPPGQPQDPSAGLTLVLHVGTIDARPLVSTLRQNGLSIKSH